jgi:hypothetical protein
MKMKIVSSLLTACFLALASVSGDVVYDNGAPNQLNGNEMTLWLQADSFQVSNPVSITSAQFWTLEESRTIWNGSLQWWVFDDAGGTPGGVLDSGSGTDVTKVATGLTPIGLIEFVYNFTLNTSVLAADTTYWFGVRLGSESGLQDIYWETTSSGALPYGYESYLGTMDNWSNNGLEHAFNLSAPTEPETPGVPDASSTALLLGFGLASFIGLNRRRTA